MPRRCPQRQPSFTRCLALDGQRGRNDVGNAMGNKMLEKLLNFAEVLVELEALQEHIAQFIRSVLICLSTIESEDRAASGEVVIRVELK